MHCKGDHQKYNQLNYNNSFIIHNLGRLSEDLSNKLVIPYSVFVY